MRSFLLKNRKGTVVGSNETIRFSGRNVQRLPKGAIRRSIEMYIESQLRFPLDTANNIRGRLRRHHFTVYKKGTEGISYVCAVKRKFRDSKTVFAPSIQRLIEFIEKNPNIPASQLSKQYLGIDTEKQKPEQLEMDDSEVAKEKAKIQNEIAEEASESKTERAEASIEPPAASAVQETPTLKLEDEAFKTLNQLMIDLRWLISEGYVTEYGDGRLFAAHPIPEAKPKKPIDSTSPEAKEVLSPEATVDERTELAPQDISEAEETL